MDEDSEKGLVSLKVWQRGKSLVVKIYRRVIPLLPPEEKWALADQIRRSVQSIPANIAEGYGRFYYQEGIRFCYLARGSLEETFSHLSLAYELGYIPNDILVELTGEIQELRRMLNGYIQFLKCSKRGADEPSFRSIGEGTALYDLMPDDMAPRNFDRPGEFSPDHLITENQEQNIELRTGNGV